eukprot:scaffold1531_cov111-Isochrysis_galbana.AAC.2
MNAQVAAGREAEREELVVAVRAEERVTVLLKNLGVRWGVGAVVGQPSVRASLGCVRCCMRGRAGTRPGAQLAPPFSAPSAPLAPSPSPGWCVCSRAACPSLGARAGMR